MVLYRGKYDLRGLAEISPEMREDLDQAYGICMEYKEEFPCEMCGKCCHQPNIIIRPEEVDRISTAAGIDLYTFMTQVVYQTADGEILLKKGKNAPCRFLGKDNKCTIWADRPEICDEFPYAVSMFMSRVYLALTNEDADIMQMIDYMDDSWPCTKDIKNTIQEKIAEGRKARAERLAQRR
jgi:Fe-S-cluster containining protein